MNVFILNSGRCGSTSFIKACEHITNYTSGHESRIHLPGSSRLEYPGNHIEADNRLCWFTGRLNAIYADKAYYVHLKRSFDDVVNSFARRADFGIMKAYREGVYLNVKQELEAEFVASDYLDTVESNIRYFLSDKSHVLDVSLETIQADFVKFWEFINAEGDLQKALAEFEHHYNASK